MTDLQKTLDERGSRYGDFTDHALLAQSLQDEMRKFTKYIENGQGTKILVAPWGNLDPVKRQALTVIMDKVARILSGDPEYKDNWHDIQGYAKLAEDRCEPTLFDGNPVMPELRQRVADAKKDAGDATQAVMYSDDKGRPVLRPLVGPGGEKPIEGETPLEKLVAAAYPETGDKGYCARHGRFFGGAICVDCAVDRQQGLSGRA